MKIDERQFLEQAVPESGESGHARRSRPQMGFLEQLVQEFRPIGVAEYQLQLRLPVEFKGKLPTAKQLADVVRSVLPEGKKNSHALSRRT
jgi:hypothetical protein